ncbi:uncharacterized protein LOC128238631 [Mya arenaria]|uniref:uncharacterized protein LOC128238631 n=1 Tax=Mya arenaria TaxID=6604 RepID=UPI0022E45EDB|nr:uncharacterized protein LOC128238631 [Mya arenaria]
MDLKPIGDGWSFNTLERATAVGQSTYSRALNRKVEWPKPLPVQNAEKDERHMHTSLDEAFGNMLHYMAMASEQCKNFHKCNPPREQQETAQIHCNRFHTGRYPITYKAHRIQGREPNKRSFQTSMCKSFLP